MEAIPDLDLSPKNASVLSRAPSQESAAIPGVGGAAFDEDDIFSPGGGSGGTLELDVIRAVPSGSVATAPLSFGLGPAPRSLSGDRFQRSEALGGIEATPEETEARALADYGDSPRSWWQAPFYTYRVWTRQSELRRQLAERQRDLTRTRDALEEVKVAFSERARSVAQPMETFAKLLEPIVTAERVMLERDTALSAELEAHRAQLRVIDDRIVQLEAELAEAKSDEVRIEDKLAEAEAVRQRAEAKVKRAEIEIRNADAREGVEGTRARAPAKGAGTPS
jgi:hypothetical protein